MADIAALIIDPHPSRADALVKFLASELAPFSGEFTESLHGALELQMTAAFDICFVSDEFSTEEVKVFLDDMRTAERDRTCVFIQLRSSVSSSVDRNALKQDGFASIVSVGCESADRKALRGALHATLYRREVESRAADIGTATKLVLKEIDRTASDRKRGVPRKISTMMGTFLKEQADFDAALITEYLEKLSGATANAKPTTVYTIEVPDIVLHQSLPELDRNGYQGTSRRVWDMLLEKHGKQENKHEPEKAPETSQVKPEKSENPAE